MSLALRNEIKFICKVQSISLYNCLPKRFLKRKYPIDRDYEFDLPVFQYPVGSSSDRRVYVWGVSEHGALGNKTQIPKYDKKLPEYHYKPLRLTFAEQHKVTDIACGYGFTVFAVDNKDKYKVFGCGLNTDSQIGYHDPRKGHPLEMLLRPVPLEIPLQPDTRVKAVAAGRAHTLVLTSDGVFSLGNNAHGQCGRKVVEDEAYFGSRVVYRISALKDANISAVHCGMDHSLFLAEDGALYSCGWGADGQLGLGHYRSQSTPVRVTGDILHEKIIKVSGSGDCVLALNDKGEVFGWGNNEYRQVTADGDVQQICSPVLVPGVQNLGKIVDIAAGGSICAALNDNGDVFAWGFGLLGVGPKVDKASKPVQIPRTLFGENMFMKSSKVVALSNGLYHLAAITNLGQLYMWGHNKGGCLGLGHIKDQFFPLKVNVGAHVLKVSAGVDHTIALCKPFT